MLTGLCVFCFQRPHGGALSSIHALVKGNEELSSQLRALETGAEQLRRQVIAGVYDAASVGITLIETDRLIALQEAKVAAELRVDELSRRLAERYAEHVTELQSPSNAGRVANKAEDQGP